jgi:hypothetical protein
MNDMIFPSDYQDWQKTLKKRIQAAQQRTVLTGGSSRKNRQK